VNAVESTIPAPPKHKPRLMDLSERIDAYGRPAEMVDGVMRPNVKWEYANIVSLRVPWSVGNTLMRMRVHKATVDKWRVLFARWEQAAMLPLLLTFNGGYNCRMKRGHEKSTQLKDLSTHAFGAAADFNAAWNVFGTPPAKLGTKGSLEALVPIAHECGFVWGGDFSDGMHFEIGATEL
jgi:hypothetical protein